ncbi:hypothetical protein NESM_000858800 [Novymonas esmeraldas]|uniref:Uncharacterized protein n=1 Tax=Novymonas esmeraldas TaxID=1808958 RepID=A0AAW0F0S4_9TRYP
MLLSATNAAFARGDGGRAADVVRDPVWRGVGTAAATYAPMTGASPHPRDSDSGGGGGWTGGARVAETPRQPPPGSVDFPTADLVERSAFLFGLLQSDHLVDDVHDAIAALNGIVGDGASEEDAQGSATLRRRTGESALVAVFYFTGRAPHPDMPWRPVYAGAVLLCVFATTAAAQRALTHVDGIALHALSRGVRTAATTTATTATAAAMARTASPHLVLRPAREFVLGPENTDTALLTYLTLPRLVDVLLLRQSAQRPHDRLVDSAALRSAMESRIRANFPPGHLCGSPARLYAALLSPQSPYAVDWAAARVAMARGDGVVVPELGVVEPWACGGAGGHGGRSLLAAGPASTARGGTQPTDAAAAAAAPLTSLEAVDEERRRRATVASADGYVPVTLQEEEYYRRYGSAGSPRHASATRPRRGSVEVLLPTRGSLYRGAHGVVRGASWLLRHLFSAAGEGETPLIMSAGALPAAPALAGAPPPPPASTGLPAASPPPVSSSAAPPAMAADRWDVNEPPRARQRVEGGGGDGSGGGGGGDGDGDVDELRGGRGQPICIPQYNAVGSALSWLPGFHHVARLFIADAAAAGGDGLPADRPLEARPQRRRAREEGGGGLTSSAWVGEARLGPGAVPGGAVPPSSALSHAPVAAPFTDSVVWGDHIRRSGEVSGLHSSAVSAGVQRPSARPSLSPLVGQRAAALDPDSTLTTPMVSSIAPNRSYAAAREGSASAAAAAPSASPHDSLLLAPSRGNRSRIRVEGGHLPAGHHSRAAQHVHNARSRDIASALHSGSPDGSDAAAAAAAGGDGRGGSLAERLRTVGGGGGRGSADTGASSTRASRRTVEFTLPVEE